MTILLARHGSHAEVGNVLSGRSEIGLSDAGHMEARRLASRLASVPLTAIQSSPRRRARETAGPVAHRHDRQVQIVDALDEIDFADWTGRSFADLQNDPEWQRWNEARRSARVPGGETMAEVTGRAVSHVEMLGPDGATFLCVSHCDVIRGVVAHYLGLDTDRLLAFDVDPGSLSALSLYPGGGRVLSVNERPR